MRPRLLTVLVVALVAGSCGSDPAPVDIGADPAPASAGSWEHHAIPGESGADQPIQLATDDDDVVAVLTSEDGTLTGYVSVDGGPLERGTPEPSGVTYLRLGGLTRLDERWITLGTGGLREVDGDGELLFETHGFASVDGRSWEPLDITGIDDPADISAIVSVDGFAMAVGALRQDPDPSRGGFRAVAWHSDDGEAWTQVALPGSEAGESVATDALVVGDTVLVAGRVESGGRLWSSADGGVSWATVDPVGIPNGTTVTYLESVGNTIVASGRTPDRRILLHSDDGGTTWQEAAEPPPAPSEEPMAPTLAGGGGRGFVTVSSFREAWSEPELCYADIELCRQDSTVTLYATDDGDHWTRIDTAGLGEGEASEVDTVLGTADGRVVAVHWTEEGPAVSVWPAGTALPTAPEPVDPTSTVVVLGDDEEPEIGVTYGVPLYIHCGMEWLYLGGQPWQRSDAGVDAETGAGTDVPADWPVAQQTIFGFATRVSEHEVEYSIGAGEVIATYAPAVAEPPGCM